MATTTMTPSLLSSRSHHDLPHLSTIPDPRTPTPQSRSMSPSPQSDHHNEVALLTNKLISAMNHQTGLDDIVSSTRLELEAAQGYVRQLESTVNGYESNLSRGELIRRSDVDQRVDKLIADLASERKAKAKAEKSKKDIELELENLTTALFEEANEMVAAARKEREDSDRRNEQLRAQLNETELLLASHQEQLADLKSVMQSMAIEKESVAQEGAHSTAPSSPSVQNDEGISKTLRGLHVGTDNVSPAPPTSFTNLLSPVLRSDVQAYEDFRHLLESSRKSAPPSRVGSGNYGGLNIMAPPHTFHQGPSNGSSTSLSTNSTWQSAPGTPNTPISASSSVASRETSHATTPLKETRFYKRALTEDIEPTLRLDTAPGLSWLNRRAVIHSMCDGSLVVEPAEPHRPRLYYPACSLCGESRKGEEYARRHRFKTSENENAQRYPLCGYCLNRLRSTCDFLGFLRMVKDGHWRADGQGAEAIAWEEAVRLRERMFWSRIGGGVIPAFARIKDTPRTSLDQARSPRSDVHVDYSPPDRECSLEANGDAASISGKTVMEPVSHVLPHNQDEQQDAETKDVTIPSPTTDEEAEAQIQSDLQQSLHDEPIQPEAVELTSGTNTMDSAKHVSLPGAFE